MEKFNNHGLDVINSRVCFALDDYEDSEEIQGQTNSKVTYKGGMKEYVDLVPLLKKLYRGEDLQDDEEEKLLKLMKQENDIVEIDVVESAISQYCNIVDSNKSFEGLYLTDDYRRKEKKEFCIRFEKETKMPQNSNAENISMEYLGYYNSEACQIILCPDRIRKTSELLKEKKVNTTSHALYGMVFIHALSHAVLDCTNKIDKEGSLVRALNQYQKIDPDLVRKEAEKQQVMLCQFMEESVATIMTLYYFLQVNTQQYKVLREWLFYQPQEYEFGLEQFDMLENGSDLIENYCAAWRERKKALKIYYSNDKNELYGL